MSIIGFLGGTITLEVKTAYSERFLNLCAKNNINLLKIKRLDIDILLIKLSIFDYKKLLKITDNTKYIYKIKLKKGIPFTIFNIRKRYALFLGFILIFFIIYNVNSRVFVIDIEGTRKTAEMSDILSDYGINIGMNIYDVDTRNIPQKIMLEYPDILWCAINIKGNTLTFEVTKRSERLDIVDMTKPCDIIADKAGLIDSISVKYGEKIVGVGQTFAKGDVLVSSKVTHYPQVEEYNQLYVGSIADIYARVWYDVVRLMPKETYEKVYTGNEYTEYFIETPKSSYILYENSGNSYAFYDKIKDTKEFNLSEYVEFPLKIVSYTYKEYEVVSKELVITDMIELLEQNTRQSIVSNIEGSITDFLTVDTSNQSVLRILYHCETLEKIGIKKQSEEIDDYRDLFRY